MGLILFQALADPILNRERKQLSRCIAVKTMAHHQLPNSLTPEHARLAESPDAKSPWRRWGTYVTERQWGTVREDYSADGDAWRYFPHDHARSRAYRWGEDGIGGWCDEKQDFSIIVSFWNGVDPILKERFFGLANHEGNHGEDIKELHWYLDGTPTSSYNRMLYKYPQGAFPYERLLRTNASLPRTAPEFEILDTGLFDDNRYFDCEIIWAKASPNDHLLKVIVHNRGDEPATLHVLPQAICTNTWTWVEDSNKPSLWATGPASARLKEGYLGTWDIYFDSPDALLFTENESNPRLHSNQPDARGYFKDAFHRRVVNGDMEAVNPEGAGTKMAAWHQLAVPAGGSREVRLRFVSADSPVKNPWADFDQAMEARRQEADSFFGHLQRYVPDEDDRRIQRQAWAGLQWGKQVYHYTVAKWLEGDPTEPSPPANRGSIRNGHWRHYWHHTVTSMPDPWEYPWFAAWDLAFHAVAYAEIDPGFAKVQLTDLCNDYSMHPSGALPAYEWKFDDVNPPVQAWAALRVFEIEHSRTGKADHHFLAKMFMRLSLNFQWWVNRKDADGQNIFEGGFLGLDNVGVFDRSQPLPGGAVLEQADATAWMAMLCLNLMRIAVVLGKRDPVFEDACSRFFMHFLSIAEAMTDFRQTGNGLWDDQDKFYYDRLKMPSGQMVPLKLRSVVGLIPLFAVEVLSSEILRELPVFEERLNWFFVQRPDLASLVSRWREAATHADGQAEEVETRLFSLLRGHRTKALLGHALDEKKFLSPFGIRSMSREYLEQPYTIELNGKKMTVAYEAGEGKTPAFGGNSNWRGPVWFPINQLFLESLLRFNLYYGADFQVECPKGSGASLNLGQIATQLADRLKALFRRGKDGLRPCMGTDKRFRDDPHFKDLVWFHEYFDGDTGRGCGANHQTGWTALVARLFTPYPTPDAPRREPGADWVET